ncbi:outer membrane lipoprotein carrier protein LolA [Rossellomorea marisflavi]|uniref:Outer membrane lipoprotein carrier protein LolA n=1 Tax=Rossellomorea marisflavi TaxID=189381 RepID=A0A0M0GLC5_9BACI|nr:outer membrane lipoprotein carrier protein LolA [Rossellomorea marisflavi]KQU57194.1 sporulation protein [Bacillus sp. Leaf406]KON90649.1 sporulation protein [Rossellomorea marisflavi]MCM2591006.1 outer membrane lipoprotein carrier protein LolA [Rossellomorea marisflavi]MDR4938928.1 outer membrane lipoprotein carrier protein LolA [Rossellomorea marisflavi]MDW4529006.1 outer membrane lipoprotein carrier protein LolA [Rossellomorea marisflavi]
MNKKLVVLVLAVLTVLMLAACGEKSKEDVTKDLKSKVEDLKGYKADAKMTLQVGEDPQTYEVEVWHNDPNYYRVSLKNEAKDQSQMILRNEEGVFVLTPALNKSFRFQSDWPSNSSQAYLYESLVKDVLEDKNATFKETKDHYVFNTKTRYQNNQMLPTQEITFNKKDLTPVSVNVMDSDKNSLVKVEFSKMDVKAAFDKKDFDMKKNMTGAQLEIPVSGNVEEKELSVLYPTDGISGSELVDEQEVATKDGKRVVLTYDGEKSFTIIQEQTTSVPTMTVSTSLQGEVVDLGFTVGAMTDQSITWTHDGVDYMLASKSLTQDEMVTIARSVQGSMVK